jgi:Ni/Fe-hydrogenase 1 B-type cytochrome subunit
MTTATRPRPSPLPRVGDYKWITLWGVPLRVMHWVAAICIVILAVTGLYIGKPYFVTSGDTSAHFLMGKVRFVHFVAAGFLVMTGIVRVYWLFAGNRYEQWHALFPVKPRDWRNLVRQAWTYITIRPEQAPRYLGHNPLQQLSYTALYGITILQVVTGFALYGQSNPGGIFYKLFNWIGPLFGGMPVVRFVHHVDTWIFAIYLPVHVYLSIRADILSHSSVISAMVSGGRIVPAHEVFEDE